MTSVREHQLPLGLRSSFGETPALAGNFSGPAIVLGRGGDWVNELDIAMIATDYEAPIFAVNAHSGHYPGCDFEHIVSIHCQSFPNKCERRADVTYHAEKPLCNCPDSDVFWPIPGMGAGSSALLATVIALNMGYDPILVAGVHLESIEYGDDGNGHKLVHSYLYYQDGWVSLRDQLYGRVFSVSPQGTFLRNLLGGG